MNNIEIPTVTNSQATNSSLKLKVIISLLILLIIGILVGASFYCFQLQKYFVTQEKSLQENIKSLQQTLTQQQEVLQKFSHQQKNTDNELLIAEVSYLIKTAHLALLLENDTPQAINSLTMAKKHLIAKPEFTTLVTAIDQDISTLQTVAAIDLKTLGARLEKLMQQLVNADTTPTMPQSKSVTPQSSLPWWRKFLVSILQELKNAVIIKKNTATDSSWLTNEQLTSATLQIQLRLLQAEWAVIQKDPVLYQTALKNASLELQKYFAQRATTLELLQELKALRQINLPAQSNIKASLEALKKIRN